MLDIYPLHTRKNLDMQSHADDSDNDVMSDCDSAFGLDEKIVFIDFIQELPFEISLSVLTYLTLHDVGLFSKVSKHWNAFANDNYCWRSIYIRKWGIKTANFGYNHTADYYTHSSRLHSRQNSVSNIPSSTTNKPTTALIVNQSNWKQLYQSRLKLRSNWVDPNIIPTKTILQGHEDSVYCVQFDNSIIVTGSRDRTVKYWSMQTKECFKTLTGHSGSVLCLQYNQKYLVTGSSDTTIKIWDFLTGVLKYTLVGHSGAVLDIKMDENFVCSCSKDNLIKVWDLKTFQLIRTMTGHSAAVNAIHLHNGILASASGDGLIKLWDLRLGVLLRDFTGHKRGLACVQFDGETIISGSNDLCIKVWNASNGEILFSLEGHMKLVRTLCFDDEWIVSGSYDESIKIFDRPSGAFVRDFVKAHDSWVFQVQMDIGRVVSASQDRTVILWDFTEGVEHMEKLYEL